MSRMRGCDEFSELWTRRHRASFGRLRAVDVLAVQDLVRAKKTRWAKDWPMIARIVDADYLRASGRPAGQRIAFWLREARSADLLLELAARFRGRARTAAPERAALAAAVRRDRRAVEKALMREEARERAADRAYWAPLRAELTRWRRAELRRRRQARRHPDILAE